MTGKENALTQQRIKSIHLKEIYLRTLKSGGISRAQLRREMQLSFPSVSALADTLIDSGILHETGPVGTSKRGRPSTKLEVNPGRFLIPTLVMERSGYRYDLYNIRAERISSGFLPFGSERPEVLDMSTIWTPSLDDLCIPVEQWVGELRKEGTPLCILFSFPGNRRDSVLSSTFLRLAAPEGMLERLEQNTELTIEIGNNASFYAYAETLYQKGISDYIFLFAGEGVGAGIIRNGAIFGEGAYRAGEIGHISIDYRGRPCVCGGCGCLERYVSTEAIRFDTNMRFDEVCRAYQLGDPAVTGLLDEKAAQIAIGISNMLTMQPSSLVLIGGPIKNLGGGFLEAVRKAAKTSGFRKLMDRVEIQYAKGEPGDDSVGALWNYLDHQLEMDTLLALQ